MSVIACSRQLTSEYHVDLDRMVGLTSRRVVLLAIIEAPQVPASRCASVRASYRYFRVDGIAESFDEVRRVYFFGCAVGGSSPLSRRYIAAEL